MNSLQVLKLENRIKLLSSRQEDNYNIIKKLKRKLKQLNNNWLKTDLIKSVLFFYLKS